MSHPITESQAVDIALYCFTLYTCAGWFLYAHVVGNLVYVSLRSIRLLELTASIKVGCNIVMLIVVNVEMKFILHSVRKTN